MTRGAFPAHVICMPHKHNAIGTQCPFSIALAIAMRFWCLSTHIKLPRQIEAAVAWSCKACFSSIIQTAHYGMLYSHQNRRRAGRGNDGHFRFPVDLMTFIVMD